MSRNKDIAFLHEFTGQPYSVCRRRMKACNWDLWKAIGVEEVNAIIENMPKIMDGIAYVVEELAHSLGDALVSVGTSLQEIKLRSE